MRKRWLIAIAATLGALHGAWCGTQVYGQTDPRFSWCPVSGAVMYELVWASTARTVDGVTPIGGTWNFAGRLLVPAAPDPSVGVPVVSLATGKTHFFSVRAQDSTGAWSALGNEVCVRVGGAAPACPLFLPVGTTCDETTGPRLPAPSIRIRATP